jgi:hypothetical protein
MMQIWDLPTETAEFQKPIRFNIMVFQKLIAPSWKVADNDDIKIFCCHGFEV